jgi:hypothetical protein
VRCDFASHFSGDLQRLTVDRDNINERFGFPLLQ